MSERALAHRNGRHIAADAPVTATLWIGSRLIVTLGNGSIRTIDPGNGHETATKLHDGAIQAACLHPDGRSVVTGGDDGRVRRLGLDGESSDLGKFGTTWIDHLAASHATGVLVAGAGRQAVVWLKDAATPSHSFSFDSTIGGMAFDGKGKRLAVSHYGGVTLLYVANPGSGRTFLPWGGSHLACTMTGDGGYLVTALQETGLHGWKLPAQQDMRMSGYRAKTRSFSWSRKEKWLATAGDVDIILWPFDGKSGPMGKAPLVLGGHENSIVTRVAFNPVNDLLAAGHSDGAVSLTRLDDGKALLVDEPGAPITALAWDKAGGHLAWGDEEGRIGLFDFGRRSA